MEYYQVRFTDVPVRTNNLTYKADWTATYWMDDNECDISIVNIDVKCHNGEDIYGELTRFQQLECIQYCKMHSWMNRKQAN